MIEQFGLACAKTNRKATRTSVCTTSEVDFSEGYLIIKMFIVRGAVRLRVRQLSLTLEPVG